MNFEFGWKWWRVVKLIKYLPDVDCLGESFACDAQQVRMVQVLFEGMFLQDTNYPLVSSAWDVRRERISQAFVSQIHLQVSSCHEVCIEAVSQQEQICP